VSRYYGMDVNVPALASERRMVTTCWLLAKAPVPLPGTDFSAALGVVQLRAIEANLVSVDAVQA